MLSESLGFPLHWFITTAPTFPLLQAKVDFEKSSFQLLGNQFRNPGGRGNAPGNPPPCPVSPWRCSQSLRTPNLWSNLSPEPFQRQSQMC